MSAFSDVDRAEHPRRLVQFLDDSARGLGAMKQYAAVAHALREPDAAVLDLGCGGGHDLKLLDDLGVRGVGIDPSAVMVGDAATRTRMPLVRGWGEQLPFRDGAFGGCRIERVLMHVHEPVRVLTEVVRCVQVGGLITVFEPDWSRLTVNGAPVPPKWLTAARNPAVGAVVGDLLRDSGCRIHDRVEERSWWTYADFERITNVKSSLDLAVATGRLTQPAADAWLSELRISAAQGTFSAEMVKILWVASTSAR